MEAFDVRPRHGESELQLRAAASADSFDGDERTAIRHAAFRKSAVDEQPNSHRSQRCVVLLSELLCAAAGASLQIKLPTLRLLSELFGLLLKISSWQLALSS